MRDIALDVAEKIREGALRTETVEWNEDEEEQEDVALLFVVLTKWRSLIACVDEDDADDASGGRGWRDRWL